MGNGLILFRMIILVFLITGSILSIPNHSNGQSNQKEPGIDLEMTVLGFTKPAVMDLKEGENTKIAVMIRNIGDLNCTSTFIIRLIVNGKEKKSETVDFLMSGENYFWNISWSKLPFEGDKTYEFKVVIDQENIINETDESNNEMSIDVYVRDGSHNSICQYLIIQSICLSVPGYVIFLLILRHLFDKDISKLPFGPRISNLVEDFIPKWK